MVLADVYKNAFELRCFRLIIGAYQTSLTEKIIQLDWNENDITSELHKLIKDNPLRVKWKISTNVEADIPKDIPKVKGFADRFPRIDFRLTTFISIYEYEYFFEAKNLKENDSALKRRYIDTGIDNMLNGKYPNGSILGYILDGNATQNVVCIKKLLIKDKRENEILQKIEVDFFDYYYESYHKNSVTIKHLMFCFTNLN